jgi:RNA polymerase sigma-70 factor (ECF subfamily)
MHILLSREVAEDVLQDSFLEAFQNLNSFDESSSFSTWLTRIAIASALEKLRALQSTIASLDEDPEDGASLADTIADWRPNPEQLYGRSELREILLGALSALSEDCRVVFLLRDVEGFSTAETAEMLRLDTNTVKSNLTRARLSLRRRLSKHFGRSPLPPQHGSACGERSAEGVS